MPLGLGGSHIPLEDGHGAIADHRCAQALAGAGRAGQQDAARCLDECVGGVLGEQLGQAGDVRFQDLQAANLVGWYAGVQLDALAFLQDLCLDRRYHRHTLAGQFAGLDNGQGERALGLGHGQARQGAAQVLGVAVDVVLDSGRQPLSGQPDHIGQLARGRQRPLDAVGVPVGVSQLAQERADDHGSRLGGRQVLSQVSQGAHRAQVGLAATVRCQKAVDVAQHKHAGVLDGGLDGAVAHCKADVVLDSERGIGRVQLLAVLVTELGDVALGQFAHALDAARVGPAKHAARPHRLFAAQGKRRLFCDLHDGRQHPRLLGCLDGDQRHTCAQRHLQLMNRERGSLQFLAVHLCPPLFGILSIVVVLFPI